MSKRAAGIALPDSMLYALTVVIYFGWDLISLPAEATKHLSYNGYMSLLVGAALYMPLFFVAADLARRFPGWSILQIFLSALGKPLGWLFCLLLSAQGFIVLFVAVRRAHLMVTNYFFCSTPQNLILLLFLAAAIYLACHGVEALTRLAGFMLIPPLAVIVGLLILGLSNVNLINLRPVLAGRPADWLRSGIELLYPLYPATTAFFYLHFFRDYRSVLKVSFSALATVLPIFILHTAGAIGAFGPHLIKHLVWPGVEYFHILDFPFMLIEQGGLLFVITWYSLQFIAASQAYFALGNQWHILMGRFKESAYTILAAFCTLPLFLFNLRIVTLQALVDRYLVAAIVANIALFILAWLAAVARGQKEAEQ